MIVFMNFPVPREGAIDFIIRAGAGLLLAFPATCRSCANTHDLFCLTIETNALHAFGVSILIPALDSLQAVVVELRRVYIIDSTTTYVQVAYPINHLKIQEEIPR